MIAKISDAEAAGLVRLEQWVPQIALAATKAELGRATDAALADLAGATLVGIVTRDAAYQFARRMAVLTEPAAGGGEYFVGERVARADPAMAGWLERGEIRPLTMQEVPAGLIEGPALGAVTLAPSAGAGALSGLVVGWPEAAPEAAAAAWPAVRLIAAVAGTAFARQAALLETGALRGSIENRIRNLIAVIRSVGGRSAERAASLDDFMLHFEGRVDALARSQIALSRGGVVEFEQILREELVAQNIQDGAHVRLGGADVSLTSDQAEALALAIHELAVNAVKFGAFSDDGGSLAVTWGAERAEGAGLLTIDWQERCGPGAAIAVPEREGFGLMVLRRALPFQIAAATELDFPPEGMTCRIAVPLGD